MSISPNLRFHSLKIYLREQLILMKNSHCTLLSILFLLDSFEVCKGLFKELRLIFIQVCFDLINRFFKEFYYYFLNIVVTKQ